LRQWDAITAPLQEEPNYTKPVAVPLSLGSAKEARRRLANPENPGLGISDWHGTREPGTLLRADYGTTDYGGGTWGPMYASPTTTSSQ